ncbi:Fur family transcriptional regulator [Clostridium aminobutyricum]|uniref:Transcriptional repressor n=1 Tax=Clostridium aminobutyricum TaxID=33953 RepID=A0A939IJG9_CLOAM|nr:Fur family transcriptional regulator [Clostridium aminobutyricum]MBN7773593.1 transcriptional repressor [Clostridium aminobutyricum]
MKQSYEFLSHELKNKNIRLSHCRSKVLEFLCKNPNHPTVDQIYSDLSKVIPTLSKTTIYNTLHILLEAGLVRAIAVEDNETRYDINTEPHGHFKCVHCGAIFDFHIDLDLLTTEELNGFKIVDRDVYFKGVCSKCLVYK